MMITVALLAAFFFFLIIEFFVPSAGVLGVMALISGIAAIISAFAQSTMMGAGVTALTLVSTPAILYFMIKLWPNTRIGRLILNRRPGDVSVAPESSAPDGTPLTELEGKIGIAKTNLLPGGLVVIEGQKLDAISSGMPIDAGTPVKVVKVVTGKIQVRAAREEELTLPSNVSKSSGVLEMPLDSLDLESLD